MKLDTGDIIKKRLLDAQESVRDYQMFSHKVDDPEVTSAFKEFAEESAMQAKKLQELLVKYENE
jgi:rubrerythrin